MSARKKQGITKSVESLCHVSRTYHGVGVPNKIRELTIRGMLLYRSLLGEAAFYRVLQTKVDFFTFLPMDVGLKVGLKFKGVQRVVDARRVWVEEKLHLVLGNTVDNVLKLIFTGRTKVVPEVYISLAKALTSVLQIEPVTADLKVASHLEAFVSPDYKDLHSCKQCNARPSGVVSVTAVDLVGFNAQRKQIVLVEIKTYKDDAVDRLTLKKFMMQAWLTRVLFMATHRPIMPHQVTVEVAVVLATSGCVQFFHVPHHAVTPGMLHEFPFLRYICREKLRVLCPDRSRRAVTTPFATVSLRTGAVQRAAPAERDATGRLGVYKRRERPKLRKVPVVKAIAQQQVHAK